MHKYNTIYIYICNNYEFICFVFKMIQALINKHGDKLSSQRGVHGRKLQQLQNLCVGGAKVP